MKAQEAQKLVVIFINQRTPHEPGPYDETATLMVQLAEKQDGYLGHYSVRDENGFGITLSYWDSEQAIRTWKDHIDHAQARQKGRSDWYEYYILQVCQISREYDWQAPNKGMNMDQD